MLKRLLPAIAFVLPSPLIAQTHADDLAWLSGLWESGPEPWIEQRWAEPRGGALIGHSRFGMNEKVLGFEFFRVQPGEDDVLVYYGQPEGRFAVPFRLADAKGMSVSFENAEHNYPQRIRFSREGDTMTAVLSRLDGSQAQTFTFHRK
jgi:hypothetical protein